MTNGQWELEELKAVLEPEEGTQRSVSCRWKHGGLGPMQWESQEHAPEQSQFNEINGIYQWNLWVYMCIYVYIWVYMVVNMGIYGYIWVYMKVNMGIYGSIWIYMGTYGYIGVYKGT